MKFIKLITTAVCCFALTGCIYQSVDQYDINKAITFCGNSENISKIDSHFQGSESVVCYDGKNGSLYDVKGTKK